MYGWKKLAQIRYYGSVEKMTDFAGRNKYTIAWAIPMTVEASGFPHRRLVSSPANWIFEASLIDVAFFPGSNRFSHSCGFLKKKHVIYIPQEHPFCWTCPVLSLDLGWSWDTLGDKLTKPLCHFGPGGTPKTSARHSDAWPVVIHPKVGRNSGWKFTLNVWYINPCRMMGWLSNLMWLTISDQTGSFLTAAPSSNNPSHVQHPIMSFIKMLATHVMSINHPTPWHWDEGTAVMHRWPVPVVPGPKIPLQERMVLKRKTSLTQFS